MNVLLALLVFHLALAAMMGLIGTVCLLRPDDKPAAALQARLKGKNVFEQKRIINGEMAMLAAGNLFARRKAQMALAATVLVGAIAAGLGTFVHFPPAPGEATMPSRAQYLAANIPHLPAHSSAASSQEVLDRMIPYSSANPDPLSTLQLRQPRPWMPTPSPFAR